MKAAKLTKEGLEKLQKELDHLKNKKRPYAVERLKTARAMGDLSENSEYSAAKEDLAFVEGRVQEIEEVLKHVEIVNHPANRNVVELGSRIRVQTDGTTDDLTIVGEFEADPINKRLSHSSPIGQALIGKKVGDEIEVNAPAGKMKYKILEIK